MDTKKIGAFLKQCRKGKNLTQEQLAEKFGVSARTVPDGKQEQICRILVYLLNLLSIMMLK